MRTIGLIGGMSWESSIEYYRLINELVRERLGGLHSAKSVMYSVDFAEIEALQDEGRWEEAAAMMVEAARFVECGGGDCLLICTNTMHRMAEEVQRAVSIPLLHIADVTAEAIKAQEIEKIGLLGTKFTMEEPYYRGRLEDEHGLEVIVPEAQARTVVHRVIYDELVVGLIRDQSKSSFVAIMKDLESAGAQGIILGCTEIGLLVGQEDARVPVFDTTHLHASAAVHFALEAHT